MTSEDQQKFVDGIRNMLENDVEQTAKAEDYKELKFYMLYSGLAIREIAACYFAMKYELRKYGSKRLIKRIKNDHIHSILHSRHIVIRNYNVDICNYIALEILVPDEIGMKCDLNSYRELERVIYNPQSYNEIIDVSIILSEIRYIS